MKNQTARMFKYFQRVENNNKAESNSSMKEEIVSFTRG